MNMFHQDRLFLINIHLVSPIGLPGVPPQCCAISCRIPSIKDKGGADGDG